MSLLGFDAVGRLALGQLPGGSQNFAMVATAGAFSISGVAATFKVTATQAVGSLTVSGIAVTFKTRELAAAGAYAETGISAAFAIREVASTASFTFNGQPVNEIIFDLAGAGSFSVTTLPATLSRTGYDYDYNLGGVGHFLEEIERQKRLNAITRKTPGPVDRRSIPRFEPLRGPPSAPAAPVPNVAAMQNQRMDAAAAQAEAAKKRRRDEEAVLLLAS